MKNRFYLIHMVIIIMLLFGGVGCSRSQQGEIIIKGPASEELIIAVVRAAMEETGMNYRVTRRTFGISKKVLSTEIHLIPVAQ